MPMSKIRYEKKGSNMQKTDRSDEMTMLAYFLAKYGVKSPQASDGTKGTRGRRTKNLPPKELAGQSFRKIFESFYPLLGDGRTLKKFVGSMNGLVNNYFRIPEKMDDWLRKYQDEHPWLKLSRDQLWSELQRLRGTRETQVASRTASRRSPSVESSLSLDDQQDLAEAEGQFSPSNENEARTRILRNIVLRRGQPNFRKQLLAAYDSKCCMTGTSATEVLEAAHIQAYSDLGTNSITNGLLLRSDLHVLFDLFMISVDPESRLIYCSERIRSVAPYGALHGKEIQIPRRKDDQPNAAALRHHFESTTA
jgi:hypothetical protein